MMHLTKDGTTVIHGTKIYYVDDRRGWVVYDTFFVDPDKELTLTDDSFKQLTPMQFYLAFTPMERIAIKVSTDPVVQEFWATYQLAVQTGASIDMSLLSNQQAIEYLAIAKTDKTPFGTYGPGVLTIDRIPEVLSGLSQ